jgi:hypothetical protein
MRKNFLLILVLITASGCAQWHSDGQPQVQAETPIQSQPTPPVVEKCVVDTVDYVLNTHVLGYEFVDEFNLKFGFNILNDFFNALEVEIPLKKAQIVLSMNLFKPMNMRAPISAAIEKAFDLNLIFKVKIDFGQIVLNPEYYYQTPLLDLSHKALDKTFEAVRTPLKDTNANWTSWVTLRPSYDEVVIEAGALAGVEKGDQFKIFNVEHLWEGQPCHSDYVMARKTSREPIAVARAERVTDHYTLLRFVAPYSTQDGIEIKTGAIVEIANLYTGTSEVERPSLLRTLRIGESKSEKLVIKGKGEFDFMPIMVEQLKPIIQKRNFVLRE